MTKEEVVDILIDLKDTVKEFNAVKFESTDNKKKLHEKISNLYGSIQEYYLDASGFKNIEVPIARSQLKSNYNNYFEAGYLSGRTFHSHQGYAELLSVIGIIQNKKNVKIRKTSNKGLTKSETIGIIAIILTFLGGSFTLGKYIGESRYDQKKINLLEENKILKKDTMIIRKSLLEAQESLK